MSSSRTLTYFEGRGHHRYEHVKCEQDDDQKVCDQEEWAHYRKVGFVEALERNFAA